MEFSEFCESVNCDEYTEWHFGEEMCYSCKLIGQSYGVDEYPENCLHLDKIKEFEKKLLATKSS